MTTHHDYHVELTREVQFIFFGIDKKFRYVRRHLSLSSEDSDPALEEYRRDINTIQGALKVLTPIEAYVLTETFKTDGTISNEWWKGIYTKSTFYRIRLRAMNKFVKEYDRLWNEEIFCEH